MKVLCSTAFKGVMPFLLEQYNPRAINSFEITYGTTLGLVEQCMARTDIDAVIFTDSGIENLLKHQKILKSSEYSNLLMVQFHREDSSYESKDEYFIKHISKESKTDEYNYLMIYDWK